MALFKLSLKVLDDKTLLVDLALSLLELLLGGLKFLFLGSELISGLLEELLRSLTR